MTSENLFSGKNLSYITHQWSHFCREKKCVSVHAWEWRKKLKYVEVLSLVGFPVIFIFFFIRTRCNFEICYNKHLFAGHASPFVDTRKRHPAFLWVHCQPGCTAWSGHIACIFHCPVSVFFLSFYFFFSLH